MPLYSMNEILDDAKAKNYGVGFYNAVNAEMTRAIIRASEDMNAPVLLGTAGGLLPYGDFDWIAPMMLGAARNAKVPVAVHFDHAYDFGTVMKALRYGFGSVMFDGSSLPIEENIEISAEIAKVAHAMGVGVESELGCVGGLTDRDGNPTVNNYTEADDVAYFLEKTNVDFLAISIGTVHGVYREEPRLDLDRLAEIRKIVDIALVLHGGSGLSKEDFKNCIAGGIQKINIYTDLIVAAMKTVRSSAESVNFVDLLKAAEASMYDVVVDKIKTFGCDNKA